MKVVLLVSAIFLKKLPIIICFFLHIYTVNDRIAEMRRIGEDLKERIRSRFELELAKVFFLINWEQSSSWGKFIQSNKINPVVANIDPTFTTWCYWQWCKRWRAWNSFFNSFTTKKQQNSEWQKRANGSISHFFKKAWTDRLDCSHGFFERRYY